MAGDDTGLSLASNVGGCGVLGAIYGAVKAVWAVAPTAKAPGTALFLRILCGRDASSTSLSVMH